jgi:beta-lactamase regulating signal transducer with metallopeptidase domain
MQALSHSPFLQALGYAITNSLWQMALLWIVVVLLNSVCRFSSANRYRIALFAQMAGFAWFLVTLRFYYYQCAEAMAAASATLDMGKTAWLVAPTEPGLQSKLLTYVIRAEQVLPYLSIAYLCLLVFLCVRWVRQYKQARQIQTTGLQKIDVHWRLFVQKVAAQLNIKKKVHIHLSPLVNSPLTIGFFKPMILVPLASINHLTAEQMEAVLLHELAHIKRADYLVNLLQSIVEITLFFNPFTQLLSKLIKKERENSCDDWVLQFQYNPSMYAEALLRIAYLQTTPALAMHAGGTDKGDLLSRVKRMLNQKEKTFHYKQQLFALLLMTGIMSSIAWLQPIQSTAVHNTTAQKTQQPVIVEPITAKVDNPLFNPMFFLSKPLKEEVSRVAETASKQLTEASADAARQVQTTLARITPSIVEKIADPSINQALDQAGMALNSELLSKLHFIRTGDMRGKQADSLNLVVSKYVKDVLQHTGNSVDWNKLQQDLSRARTDIAASLIKNKTLTELGSAAISTEINQALGKAFSDVNEAFGQLRQPEQNKLKLQASPPAPQPPAGMAPVKKLRLQTRQQPKEHGIQEDDDDDADAFNIITPQFRLDLQKAHLDSLKAHLRAQIQAFRAQEQAAREAQKWVYYQPVYVEKVQAPSFIIHTGNTSAPQPAEACTQDAQPEAPAAAAVTCFQYKQVRVLVCNKKGKNSRSHHSTVNIRKLQTDGDRVNVAIEISEEE